MTSIFEAPASRPTGSILKILGAFVAGIVVAAAMTRVPAPTSDVAQSNAAARAQDAALKRQTAAKPSAAAPVAAAAVPQASAPVRDTVPPPAGGACDQQTWPYVDQRCGEPDTNTGEVDRRVRVIATEKSASATTAAVTPQQVQPPGSENAPASQAPPLPAPSSPRGTLPVNGPSSSSAAAYAPPPGAAAVERPAAAPKAAIPTARAGEQPADEAYGRSKPEASKDTRGAAGAKRDMKRARPADKPADKIRTARSRAPEQRGGDLQERNEADGFALVRSHTLPDGRRVTVYRTSRGDDSMVASGDNYRVRRVPLSRFGEDEDD